MRNHLPLEETSLHKSVEAQTNRRAHRAKFRADQAVIDNIVSAATSTLSPFDFKPDPLPWKVSFAEAHPEFDANESMVTVTETRDRLRK
jgi:hypothetical protein